MFLFHIPCLLCSGWTVLFVCLLEYLNILFLCLYGRRLFVVSVVGLLGCLFVVVCLRVFFEARHQLTET